MEEGIHKADKRRRPHLQPGEGGQGPLPLAPRRQRAQQAAKHAAVGLAPPAAQQLEDLQGTLPPPAWGSKFGQKSARGDIAQWVRMPAQQMQHEVLKRLQGLHAVRSAGIQMIPLHAAGH